jgi:hypothetical protein
MNGKIADGNGGSETEFVPEAERVSRLDDRRRGIKARAVYRRKTAMSRTI